MTSGGREADQGRINIASRKAVVSGNNENYLPIAIIYDIM
jgi:hypothetical protein